MDGYKTADSIQTFVTHYGIQPTHPDALKVIRQKLERTYDDYRQHQVTILHDQGSFWESPYAEMLGWDGALWLLQEKRKNADLLIETAQIFFPQANLTFGKQYQLSTEK